MELDMLNKVTSQIDTCNKKYGNFASLHEAYGVFKEEFRELENEIFKKNRDFDRIEAEIIDNLTVLVRMYDFAKTKNNR